MSSGLCGFKSLGLYSARERVAENIAGAEMYFASDLIYFDVNWFAKSVRTLIRCAVFQLILGNIFIRKMLCVCSGSIF